MSEVHGYEGSKNSVVITIDWESCTGCGSCVDVCPSGVYVINAEGFAEAANVNQCIQCAACNGVCPSESITHTAW